MVTQGKHSVHCDESIVAGDRPATLPTSVEESRRMGKRSLYCIQRNNIFFTQ